MASAFRKYRKYAYAAGALAAVVVGLVYAASNYVYSEGHRDGFIQKFSHRGLIWKTHEAELGQFGFKTVTTSDGDGGWTRSSSNAWEFTVPHGSPLVEDLKALKPSAFVRVHYEERLIRLPWRGSTAYYATKVEVVSAGENPKVVTAP